MKIVVVGTRGYPNVQGGVETHCEHLYPRLAKLGCDLTVFARSPYVSYKSERHEDVNLVAITCPQSKHFETLVHTAKAILKSRSLRPDVIHIQGIGPSLFAPLPRLFGTKVVVTHHGENYKHNKWGGGARLFLRLCEAVGVLSAHEIIAISGHLASSVEGKYMRKPFVVPNGVEIPIPLTTTATLHKFGLERGKYLLAVGRLVPEKGFHDLLEAFCKTGLEGWKLAIVGKADHEDAYSAGIKLQAAQNRDVVLTGFLKGMPLQELYSHAGVFVIPSYYEGLPIVLLEALSYGLPCIASDIPANRNLTLPKERYFKAGDVDDLAAAIAYFTTHPPTPAEMKAQVEMVGGQYDWDRIAGEVLKVYQKALAVNPSPQLQGLSCSRNRKN